MNKLFTILGFFLSFNLLSAQTIIWEENFDSYADGTTIGTANRWTGVCAACISGDHFEVRSGQFSGVDVNDFSTWETESIDISAFTDVNFSLDAIENGDHEGVGCSCGINQDYFDVYYSVDGGPFTVIENWNGDGEAGHTLTGDSQNGISTDADWGATTVSQGGINGNSLVIRVVVRNTAGSEELSFDNVVVSSLTVLPLALEDFSVRKEGNQAILNWETSSELNFSHFELEKSIDAIHFENIAKVEAQGAEDFGGNYNWVDDLKASLTYYRLKQLDRDGSFSYSKIISLSGELTIQQAPYPNPFKAELFLDLKQTTSVQIISIDGGHQLRLELNAGLNNLQQYIADFPAGLLFITIKTAETAKTYKVQKFN